MKQRKMNRSIRAARLRAHQPILEQFESRSLLSAVTSGPEIRVNTIAEGAQNNIFRTRQYIDSDSQGNFVVVWPSEVGPNQTRMAGRRFDAHGTPFGDQFWIEPVASGLFINGASVAMAPAGNFAVAWSPGDTLLMQQFDAAGNPVGSQINLGASKFQPQIAMNDAGEFVVVWGNTGTTSVIAGQRFAADGETLGGQFLVSQSGVVDVPAIDMDATGNFVVAWQRKPTQMSTDEDIYARRFDSNGQPLGDQFLVHAASAEVQRIASVGMDADGDFVVTWRHRFSLSELRGRRFDKTGSPLGAEFRIDRGRAIDTATVIMRDDGQFVVAYAALTNPGDPLSSAQDLFARSYNNTGNPGPEFRVGTKPRAQNFYPSGTFGPDGSVTFAYFGFGDDTDNSDVFVRQLAADDLQGSVESRLVFYNQSVYDGNDIAANAADDGAVAGDKQALLPGQTGTFANYTSYSRGINGVMIDVLGLPGRPTAGDFTFKVGNSGDPSTWSEAPTPTSISVRQGAGVNGSARITLVWPDGAIRKQWLQVIVWPNDRTGLPLPDVFYFGNAVGESGNELINANVSITDELLARNNATTGTIPAPVTNRFDYNRDGRVSVVDQLLARNNITTAQTVVKLISVPTALPLMLDSPAFLDGQAIPLYYTADGQNVSPPLRWLGAPQGTREFALIVDDPDAPTQEPFVHWVIYKIPATLNSLPENINKVLAPAEPAGVLQGRGSSGSVGYRGPSPPAGPVHHYHFTLYALDAELSVSSGLTKLQLLSAMSGHILATDELIGTYKR